MDFKKTGCFSQSLPLEKILVLASLTEIQSSEQSYKSKIYLGKKLVKSRDAVTCWHSNKWQIGQNELKIKLWPTKECC